MKDPADMSFDELVEWSQDKLINSIREENFETTLAVIINKCLAIGYDRGKEQK